MEDRFALLIDADNVSAKYIKPILDELSKYGNVTYKRIYGDWTKTNNASWKEELLQNSITPIQQFSYTHGKNATDSAMIIDAMDMLYTSELEGFCLVSSDSDFTKLASRLRESGKTVIGMGEGKTPSPFRKACDIFTELELLLEDNTMGKEERNTHSHASGKWQKKDNHDSMVSKEKIEEAVVKIITENQNNDRETGLGEVGSRLVKLYPDFDVRRYGYSLLSKFLESLPKLMLMQEGTKVTVTIYEDKSRKEMLEELFTFTKLKNDSFHLEMSSCCINKILKDTIFSYYDEWTGRGIEPEIQITDKLLFMNGNEQGIQRIFQNIIKNGLDHGEKKISISLEEVENNIRIQIKNQVCHVEKINVDQVFERFYKADEARSKTSSGLGLSIAKELVLRMDGKISARIEGNEFCVEIVFPK